MQYGSAWWFLDQLDGMTAQMDALSNMGLLSRFVGMVTDSRSFLSYSRHEYFRRLLCNLLGEDVRRGLLPDDRDAARAGWSRNVCFFNARDYFGFPLGTAADGVDPDRQTCDSSRDRRSRSDDSGSRPVYDLAARTCASRWRRAPASASANIASSR